jgi:O-antigen/teichoic acid export membrane protein
VIYNSIVVLLLARFSGTAAVGIYALASTLARSFLFVSEALATLLMPRIAATSDQSHANMLKKLMALTITLNGILLVLYLVLVEWFVTQIFGTEYFEGGITTYAILALAMIVLGTHSVVTAVLVGKGMPSIETVSRVIALIATATSGWLLIPTYGPAGAAVAMLAGALGAVSYYAITLLNPTMKLYRRR